MFESWREKSEITWEKKNNPLCMQELGNLLKKIAQQLKLYNVSELNRTVDECSVIEVFD